MCMGENKMWQQERKEKVKHNEGEVVFHDVNKNEFLFQQNQR